MILILTLILMLLASILNSSQAFQMKNVPKMASVSSTRFASSIQEDKIFLKSGTTAQVLSCTPFHSTNPPLAFIHGSFHAAWCWTEHYFPFFVELGYPVVALSLRGTGGTFAGQGVKSVKIEDHAMDLQAFLEELPNILNITTADTTAKPILISHSFGGLAVMKHLEMHPDDASKLGGIVTLCSVPPSGNGKMTMRFLRRSLVDGYKITMGFAMKKCIQDEALCRDLFFGGQVGEDGAPDDFGLSQNDIQRYQSYFKRDTDAIIDITDLVKRLPSKKAKDGKAPYLDRFPPCMVVGATRDFIVDVVGVEETATYFGVNCPTFVDSPHDVMLGRNWKNGAEAIHLFIQYEALLQ